DHHRRHATHHTMPLIESAADQGTRSHHGFRLQHRALEYLNIPTYPHPVGDLYIARSIESLPRDLIKDRVLVTRTDNDVRGQHAIPADIDTRRLIHPQAGPLHRGP